MIISLSKRIVVSIFALMLATAGSVQIVSAESPVWSADAYIRVGANGYPYNINSLPDAYVVMYEVKPVTTGVYNGKKVSVKKQINGVAPTFKVSKNRIVDFVTFSDRTTAIRSTRWTFTTPPYKNFDDGQRTLCQTNYLDTTSRLTISGQNGYAPSCAYGSMNYPLSEKYVAFEDNTRSYSKNSLASFEAWPMETNTPTSVVRDANVSLFDEYGRRVASVVNTGDRGIATFIVQRGKRYYAEAEKNGRKFGGRMKVYYPNETAIFYISRDGKKLFDAYTGSSTYVVQQNLYPQNGLTIAPVVIPTSLATPAVTNPINNAILSGYAPQTVYLTWTPVSGATAYEVELERDTNCLMYYSSPCSSYWAVFDSSTVRNVTSFTTRALTDNSKYRVAVRARNNSGVYSNWSSYVYFSYDQSRTVTPVRIGLSAPSISYPSNYEEIRNDGIPKAVNLLWSSVSGASNYEVDVDYSLCPTCSGYNGWLDFQLRTGVANNNFTTNNLSANNQYRFRVRARGYEGEYSAWSEYRYFAFGSYPRTPVDSVLTAPVIYSPASYAVYKTFPRTVFLSWAAVSGATSYQYEVYRVQNIAGNVTYYSYGISNAYSTSATSYTLPNDNAYAVRIRAVQNGVPGTWSGYRYFYFASDIQEDPLN